MKKVLLIMLCALLVLALVGCGQVEEEYMAKVDAYYLYAIEESTGLGSIAETMIENCMAADEAGIALAEIKSDELDSHISALIQTSSDTFDTLEDPPQACMDAYAMAREFYDAEQSFYATLTVAYEETTPMTGVIIAEQITENYEKMADAALALGKYLEK